MSQESRDKLKAMVPAMFQGGSSAGHSYILAFVALDPQAGNSPCFPLLDLLLIDESMLWMQSTRMACVGSQAYLCCSD